MLIETPISDYIFSRFKMDILHLSLLINLTHELCYKSAIGALTNIRDALIHYLHVYENQTEFFNIHESQKLTYDERKMKNQKVYSNIVCMKEHLRRARTDTIVNICTFLSTEIESKIKEDKNAQKHYHKLRNVILEERLQGKDMNDEEKTDSHMEQILDK